jgi:hypothetical protein
VEDVCPEEETPTDDGVVSDDGGGKEVELEWGTEEEGRALWEVAAEVEETPDEEDGPLSDVAAELEEPATEEGGWLSDVAAELEEPATEEGGLLSDVAAELEEPASEEGAGPLELPPMGSVQRPSVQARPGSHRPLGKQGLPSLPSPLLPAVLHTPSSSSQ